MELINRVKNTEALDIVLSRLNKLHLWENSFTYLIIGISVVFNITKITQNTNKQITKIRQFGKYPHLGFCGLFGLGMDTVLMV